MPTPAGQPRRSARQRRASYAARAGRIAYDAGRDTAASDRGNCARPSPRSSPEGSSENLTPGARDGPSARRARFGVGARLGLEVFKRLARERRSFTHRPFCSLRPRLSACGGGAATGADPAGPQGRPEVPPHRPLRTRRPWRGSDPTSGSVAGAKDAPSIPLQDRDRRGPFPRTRGVRAGQAVARKYGAAVKHVTYPTTS